MREKILLLHGALGNKNQFNALIKLLEDDFDVYTLDFEGHAKSHSSSEFTIDLFSKNVIDFLTDESIDKINIFGYSMGGYVALNTALQIPQKISKIITLGTKFNWDIESTSKELKMLNPEMIEVKVPQYAAKLNEAYYPQDWKEVVRKTARMMEGLANGNKLKDEKLMLIKQEVIIGLGNLDKMVSYEESKQTAELLVNGTFKLIEGIEHPIEKSEAQLIANYITDCFK